MNNLPVKQQEYFETNFFAYEEMSLVSKEHTVNEGRTKDEACKMFFHKQHIIDESYDSLRQCSRHRMLLEEHKPLIYFVERYKPLLQKFIQVAYRRVTVTRTAYLFIKGYEIKPSVYAYLSHKYEDIYKNFTSVDTEQETAFKLMHTYQRVDYTEDGNHKRIDDGVYNNMVVFDADENMVKTTVKFENGVPSINGESFKMVRSGNNHLLKRTKIVEINDLDNFLEVLSLFISNIHEDTTETWEHFLSKKSNELLHMDADKVLSDLQKPLDMVQEEINNE
jgi:hypothetical protein